MEVLLRKIWGWGSGGAGKAGGERGRELGDEKYNGNFLFQVVKVLPVDIIFFPFLFWLCKFCFIDKERKILGNGWHWGILNFEILIYGCAEFKFF